MASEEFLLLPVSQLIDIISSEELNVHTEEQVYDATIAWVKYALEERKAHLPVVSSCYTSDLVLRQRVLNHSSGAHVVWCITWTNGHCFCPFM